MAAGDDDLDLLLSLRDDRVLETPPGSPGYNSDGDEFSRRPDGAADMSVFRDAVKDYLEKEEETLSAVRAKPKKPTKPGEVEVEKFSGLRIRNSLISPIELSSRFSDVRFVRLSAIRNLLSGDTLSGCWATVGVMTETGDTKLSSAGKNYCIWKMGCLDESNVSVFLFGDAYSRNCKETVGTVYALFNATVRKDSMGSGFSLSVYSAGQMLKVGVSVDHGICKGKRKDGMPCTLAVNKRKGLYCKYHSAKAAIKYSTTRSELKGGNLQAAFRRQSEGIYMIDPHSDISDLRKPAQRVKVMSVDGLKKALSKADKVTTNSQSQGIRFLTQVTASMEPKTARKVPSKPNQVKRNSEKRPSISIKKNPNIANGNEWHAAKRKKTEHSCQNMIELEVVSSDDEG